MATLFAVHRRLVLGLLVAGLFTAGLLFANNGYDAYRKQTHVDYRKSQFSISYQDSNFAVLDRLAVIFPVNNNTDMQFYRNTWLRDYLYPVCDWPEPGCKIVCNQTSTYRTLDKKTRCFSREIKKIKDKEFFIKLDDDSFVDRDYIVRLMRKFTGQKAPVYISDHQLFRDPHNQNVLDRVRYGNGKFYMFNRNLVECLDVDLHYSHSRNEDAVFGGMVHWGCGEANVAYVGEDDSLIWHKSYISKNKFINLAYLTNH